MPILQKQTSSGQQSQKKKNDLKSSSQVQATSSTNDYYTVQNHTRLNTIAAAAQQSVQQSNQYIQQSSRNHGQNTTKGAIWSNIHTKDGTSHGNTFEKKVKVQTPSQNQRGQQMSQNELQANFIRDGFFEKSQSYAASSHITLKQPQFSIRNSIQNEKANKSRALSTSKSGIQSGFGQSSKSVVSNMTTLRQQSKLKSKPMAQLSNLLSAESTPKIPNNYKKSMVQPTTAQYSPKPDDSSTGKYSHQNNVYRSPQQSRKHTQQQSIMNIISSSSPLPTSNHLYQQNFHYKGASSRISTANSDAYKQSNPRINQNKKVKNLGTVNHANGQASLLQIDLSSLSNKNDDDIAFSYGASLNTNQLRQLQKSNIRKQTSISQNKKTPIHLTSHSPSLKSSHYAAKSPKTFKQVINNRQSILNTINSNNQALLNGNLSSLGAKSKLQTPKMSESHGQYVGIQKNLNQKIIKENSHLHKHLKNKDTMNQQRIKSPETITDRQSGGGVTTAVILVEGPSIMNENFENFSFTSNKVINQLPNSSQNTYKENDYAVSDEQSNLNSQKSSLLQVKSSPDLEKIQSMTTFQSPSYSKRQSVDITLSDVKSKQEDKFPMGKKSFLNQYESRLLQFEIQEIQDLKFEQIYFAGKIFERTNVFIRATKNKAEEEIIKSLDDEEGYYNVIIGDHLMYRYEIMKILGKGSFAQVACCLDKKTGKKVAIKITRNTEIDHKFASSESKLLNYLMINDPNDSHNIVRLIDEFYFRDHHCFVFELLKTDLFEYLKENGFMGFETGKIREYAIQILQALMFLERHNLIHCDLKPENILLVDDAYKKIKLVDYGSGCFKQEQVYTYVQSRFYRAPEVILRIPYSEKVDMWSFGCILAELYTGEPLFPGNNEQEQLELVMEVCGIPPGSMIDKSRKKEHYFDVDYSPYLIEDEELGILRIPESKRLEDVVSCQDVQFLDFIRRCLELDPEQRFSASEAIQHPWIKKGLKSHAPVITQITMNRRREEEQEGVKGKFYEESPMREILIKPKKSLTKHLNFQAVKVGLDDNDSNMSSPKNEGGIQQQTERTVTQDIDLKYQILDQEAVANEQVVDKPHNGSIMGKKSLTNILEFENPNDNKCIGKYEIIRDVQSSEIKSRESHSRTSGIASEANIPPVNQHEIINNENQINKITITLYQKRNNPKKV